MKINLKELRKEKGWTQEQTAKNLEISLSYVKKLDTGTKSPGLKMAQRIAKIFGCKSIDEVIKAS